MFNEKFISTLKSFSRINLNLLFDEGKLLRTISVDGGMYAEADLEFGIDEEASVYDLKKFLSALSLVGTDENLTVDFSNELILLENKERTVFYRCADKQTLELPPAGRLDIPTEESGISFQLSEETLNYITSACSAFELSDIVFETEDGELFIKSVDEDDSLKNKFQSVLTTIDKPVKSSVKYRRFLIAPDNYNCILQQDDEGDMLYMEGENLKIRYWISL